MPTPSDFSPSFNRENPHGGDQSPLNDLDEASEELAEDWPDNEPVTDDVHDTSNDPGVP